MSLALILYNTYKESIIFIYLCVLHNSMRKTMIQVDVTTRDKIKSLGKMGESYTDVLNKLYELAIKRQMENYLMDTAGYIDLDELL